MQRVKTSQYNLTDGVLYFSLGTRFKKFCVNFFYLRQVNKASNLAAIRQYRQVKVSEILIDAE